MEIYEKIAKVVSAILAICCMVCMWQIGEIYKQAERYPVKEEEYISLENYALETAKNLNEEDIKISKEEIARRKNDNYRVIERRYANDKFFVKVKSDIAEVEAVIPVSAIEEGKNESDIYFEISLKYNEATYIRKNTIHPLILYVAMSGFMACLLAVIFFYILWFIGIGVFGGITLIKFIVQKIKKQ